MPKHRFHCAELRRGTLQLDPAESRHAAQVLRLQAGAEIELFDGRGSTAVGRIVQSGRNAVSVSIEHVASADAPPPPHLTLVTAMPRTHRQQFLFEKCTELGVMCIVPTQFERSTVKPKRSAVEKWQRMVVEAGKQAGCFHLPRIEEPASLEATLASIEADARWVGSPGLNHPRLWDKLHALHAAERVTLWIGPEGGLTDAETGALADAGVEPVSLGPQILRIETAAVAAAAAVALSR